MRIVEAHILTAGQGHDQPLLGNGNGPGHGAAAIAVLYPPQRIGLIAALAQMQQTGGFAYAQPNACCIFNHLHSLELFLTSSPSLEGDRISLQLWGDIILEHLQRLPVT